MDKTDTVVDPNSIEITLQYYKMRVTILVPKYKTVNYVKEKAYEVFYPINTDIDLKYKNRILEEFSEQSLGLIMDNRSYAKIKIIPKPGLPKIVKINPIKHKYKLTSSYNRYKINLYDYDGTYSELSSNKQRSFATENYKKTPLRNFQKKTTLGSKTIQKTTNPIGDSGSEEGEASKNKKDTSDTNSIDKKTLPPIVTYKTMQEKYLQQNSNNINGINNNSNEINKSNLNALSSSNNKENEESEEAKKRRKDNGEDDDEKYSDFENRDFTDNNTENKNGKNGKNSQNDDENGSKNGKNGKNGENDDENDSKNGKNGKNSQNDDENDSKNGKNGKNGENDDENDSKNGKNGKNSQNDDENGSKNGKNDNKEDENGSNTYNLDNQTKEGNLGEKREFQGKNDDLNSNNKDNGNGNNESNKDSNSEDENKNKDLDSKNNNNENDLNKEALLRIKLLRKLYWKKCEDCDTMFYCRNCDKFICDECCHQKHSKLKHPLIEIDDNELDNLKRYKDTLTNEFKETIKKLQTFNIDQVIELNDIDQWKEVFNKDVNILEKIAIKKLNRDDSEQISNELKEQKKEIEKMLKEECKDEDAFNLFADLNEKDNAIKELIAKSEFIDEYGANLFEIKTMFNDVEKSINEVLFDLEDKLDLIYGNQTGRKERRKRSIKLSTKRSTSKKK